MALLNPHNQQVSDHAKYLASIGYIPLLIHGVTFIKREDLNYHPVCSCYEKESCKTPGKHPVRGWNQNAMATPTEGVLLLQDLIGKASFAQNFNLGVRTGPEGGCFAIDIDVKGNGFANFKEFLGSRQIDDIVHYRTLTARTGGGGRHFIYTYPKTVEKIASVANHAAFNFKLNPKDPDSSSVDIRGDGGYIVVWPSFHKSGNQYLWEYTDLVDARRDAPESIIHAVEKRRKNSDSTATYTPDIAELRALGARLVRNKKEDTALIGRLLLEILDGKPIKLEGGAHDAFKTISYRVAIEYPRADPINMAEFFRASIDARADTRPDGSCTFDDVFKCVESALKKRRADLEHWENKLITNEKGQPTSCTKNVISVLKNAPEWDGVFALNARSYQPMVLREIPGLILGDSNLRSYPRPLMDADQIYVSTRISERFNIPIRRDHVNEAIDLLSQERSIDLFLEYFRHLPRWDRIPRVDMWLIEFGGAEDTPYTREVSGKFLLQMAKRTLEPGCQADGVLILEGKQGIGKSSLLRAIVPLPSLFCDDLSIISAQQNKDNILKLLGPAINEFAELSAMHKGDVEPVKAFVTVRYDKVRFPYAHNTVECPRRCVFAGSTNSKEYLRDPSGNRRFWPVELTKKVDVPSVIAHRDQIWAEAIYRIERGEPVYLTAEMEITAAEVQESRVDPELWHEKIENWLSERDSVIAKYLSEPSSTPISDGTNGSNAVGNIGNTEIDDQDAAATFFWLRRHDGNDFWDRALREKYGEVEHFTTENVYRMLFDDGQVADHRTYAMSKSIGNTLRKLGYTVRLRGKNRNKVWIRDPNV